MALRMFDALLPYFGSKRKLCPVIFHDIDRHFPRGKWQNAVFVDAFLGSCAVSLYAKAQGFRVIANDIAERSYIAGKSLIENNQTLVTEEDIYKLFRPNEENKHLVEQGYVPKVFIERHAKFLDLAFANATRYIDKYLLIKYMLHLRPYSKFSSPNAFNKPMSEGRYDEIKHTYIKHIIDNLRTPLGILRIEKDKINQGVFSNGLKNEVCKQDVFDFVKSVEGDILYLDPPYSGTLAYEKEYQVLDKILEKEIPKSRFSSANGMEVLGELLGEAEKFPLWVISFGNAGGKNDLDKLVGIVSRYRKCKARDFIYVHCEAMASKKHKKMCKEWVVIGWK